MKKRNLVFTVLFCLFLLGPAGVFMADKAGIDLPGWLTAEDSRYLSGGIEKASVGKNLSVEGFGTERLQDAIETKIGNNIPMKSTALLANAGLQRSAIAGSNSLFGWDCYPTYFGSNKLYLPSDNALSRMPYQKPYDRAESYVEFVRLLNKAAKSYPDKHFVLYLADLSQNAVSNPAGHLVSSGQVTVDELVEMGEEVVDADNLMVLGRDYATQREYFQTHYTTDHHWNGFGCSDAFRVVTDNLNIGLRMTETDSVINPKGQFMNGSNSRLGLMLLDEQIREPVLDLTNVQLIEGKSAPVLTSDLTALELNPLEEEFDFYHAWYGKGAVQTRNTSHDAQGKVLLIGDSYTYSMRWFFAGNVKDVSQYPDLIDGMPERLKSSGKTLGQRLAAFDADTVVFVAAEEDCGQMSSVYPGYFE